MIYPLVNLRRAGRPLNAFPRAARVCATRTVAALIVAALCGAVSPCPATAAETAAFAAPDAALAAGDIDYDREVQTLATNRLVQRAFALIDRLEPEGERDLIELTEIAAPPFLEDRRAHRYADMLSRAGLVEVAIDQEGNVIARRRGTQGAATVALVAHLDSVFPEGTEVTVRREGDRLFAPGVGDNARGLVVMLTLARVLEATGLQTQDDLLFVGTVGEEGVGDLRGAKHLLRHGGNRVDQFIAIDGGSIDRVVNRAVGSVRYRLIFRGPGGHSWGAFGLGNPVHALARALYYFDEQAAVFVQSGPRSTYNVGLIGGGTSVNSIPFDSWAEVDMRSEDPQRLADLDALFRGAVDRALTDQNVAASGEALTVELRPIGQRPSGTVDPATPLVRRAMASVRYFGAEPELSSGSTDANVPIAMGIPAITIGRGGTSGGAHSLEEWWANVDGATAIKNALLITLASARLTTHQGPGS